MTAQQITDIKSRLELFLDEQNGRVFTNEDVVEYLEMTGEFNNTPATLKHVFDELLQLNCTVDINVSFQQREVEPKPRERFVEPYELYI